MRGESQSYLLGTTDGNYFVTKFAGREGARRRLINEWVGSKLLSRLGVATPLVRIVETSEDFIESHRGQFAAAGLDPSVLRGLHFGSQVPGDPAKVAIYDYLPDRLLAKVENLGDFIGALTVDLWCGKTSKRQAIFVRADQKSRLFRALMIDNDEMFGGGAWRIGGASPGLHLSLVPYANLVDMAALDPWLSKIESIPQGFFPSLVSSLPEEWIQRDGLALIAMLRRLSIRRDSLRSLALTYLRSNSKLFPQWVKEETSQLASAVSNPTEPSSACSRLDTRVQSGVMPVGHVPLTTAQFDGDRRNCTNEVNSLSSSSASVDREMMKSRALATEPQAILETRMGGAENLAGIVLRRIRTILRYDSLFDLQPAGARSLPLGCGNRTLLFLAGKYSVDLQVEALPDSQKWTLVGQLSNNDNPADEMANLRCL